jgi:hypothetical protein
MLHLEVLLKERLRIVGLLFDVDLRTLELWVLHVGAYDLESSLICFIPLPTSYRVTTPCKQSLKRPLSKQVHPLLGLPSLVNAILLLCLGYVVSLILIVHDLLNVTSCLIDFTFDSLLVIRGYTECPLRLEFSRPFWWSYLALTNTFEVALHREWAHGLLCERWILLCGKDLGL